MLPILFSLCPQALYCCLIGFRIRPVVYGVSGAFNYEDLLVAPERLVISVRHLDRDKIIISAMNEQHRQIAALQRLYC